MFSRKLFIVVGIALFIAINFIVISLSSRDSLPVNGIERLFISIASPVQHTVTKSIHYIQNIWNTYFLSVLAVQENIQLKEQLGNAREIKNQYEELKLENIRLKRFVNFTGQVPDTYVAAQIIARDPSPWFKTVMIDKGSNDGLSKGNPVLVSEGIVGKIVKVAAKSSRVLLIIDRNSSVDALVQNSRVRGIVKGNNQDNCSFVFTLRKDQVKLDEMIISSGLDQIFPKGLQIGRVLKVTKGHSRLFQNITIKTTVDFDKIEEVLVIKK